MAHSKDSFKGLVCGIRQSQMVLKPDFVHFMEDFLHNHTLIQSHGSFDNIPFENRETLRADFVAHFSRNIDMYDKKVLFDLNTSIKIPILIKESSFSEIISSDPQSFRHGHISSWKCASQKFMSSSYFQGKHDLKIFFKYCFLREMEHEHSVIQKIHCYYVMKSIDDSFNNSDVFHVYLKMNTKFHIHEFIQLHNLFLRYGTPNGFPGPLDGRLICDWVFRGNGHLYPADFKTIYANRIGHILDKIALKKYSVIISSPVDLSHNDLKNAFVSKQLNRYLIDNKSVSQEEVASFNPHFYSYLDKVTSGGAVNDVSVLFKHALNYVNNSSQLNNGNLSVIDFSPDSHICFFKGDETLNVARPDKVLDFFLL